jgi:hypothetical protein
MASPNNITNLIATTINNYTKTFQDNVSNSNALTAMLRMGDRIRTVDGGKTVSCTLQYAEETFAWYQSTDLLSRALKETISEADFDPANAVASVTISGPDLAKNAGKERILNLLEGKMDNAQNTMNNNITKAVYGDGTLAKSFAGLKAFVTDNGLGIVGGIDASTWTFWANQFQPLTLGTGLTYAVLKAGMNSLWMKLIRGTEHPDLVVMDSLLYSTYEGGLQENQRFGDAKLGGLGFETLKYKQAAAVFDGTPTGLTGGYMLNTKYMKLEAYTGRNFQPLDVPDQTPDMDAVTHHIAFMGGLTLANRAMQGRLQVPV